MGNLIISNEELIGKKFGKLTVLSLADKVGVKQYYNCKCDCGENVRKTKIDLTQGKRLACRKCLVEEKSINQVSDIIGKKFGKLTVISISRKDPKNKQFYYNCKCDCGNFVEKPRRALLERPDIHQCKECDKKSVIDNIIGKQFGQSIVLEFDHENQYGMKFYKCKCKNGHIYVKNRSGLLNGSDTNCAECTKISKQNEIDSIVGKKFGKLTVFDIFKDNNNYMCKCKCECGNIVNRRKDYLISTINDPTRTPMCDLCALASRLNNQIEECIGKRYGRLVVKSFAGFKDVPNRPGEHEIIYNCECDCGNHVNISKRSLTSGRTVSCGCYNREKLLEANTTHGMSSDKFYHCYYDMLDRCFNPNNNSYENYGKRGITVDSRWLGENGFTNFKNDMYESYLEHKKWYPDDTSIDRINNDGNYCKENCRWATMKVQSNNQRKTVHFMYGGHDYTISEFQEKFCPDLDHNVLYWRIINGGFANSEVSDYDIANLTTLNDKRFPKNAFKPL